MDNLEGFPEKTCTVDSYKRWILFPLIFKSVPVATMHQPLVSYSKSREQRQVWGKVAPVLQCQHWWAQFTGSEHGKHSWVLVTGFVDTPRQDGAMRFHPGLETKHQNGPNAIQETGPKNWVQTTPYTRGLSRRASYTLSQSMRWRQGCRQIKLQPSSGREQGASPALNQGAGGMRGGSTWEQSVSPGADGALRYWHLQFLNGWKVSCCTAISHEF